MSTNNGSVKSGNSRTLYFTSSDLGKDVTLMLTFQPPPTGELNTHLFPVCWKIIRLPAWGLSSGCVLYSGDTGLLIPQDNTKFIAATDIQPCQPGQLCTMMTDKASGKNYLTEAAVGKPNLIECNIQTSYPASLGLGFFTTDREDIKPAFLWNPLEKGATVSFKLTPVLRIYAIKDYKANEILTDAIPSAILFSEDLNELPGTTSWDVSIDEVSDEVRIRRAE